MQRKVFRIEQMMTSPRRTTAAAPAIKNESPLARELGAVHDVIAHYKRELTTIVGDGKDRPLQRASGELGAAVDGMDKATQDILGFAERIDDGARSLAAALKGDYERGLAHDIQEHIARIYESCNFQDLAGQRIGKVMAMLDAIEQQVAGMLTRCGNAETLPRAPGKPKSGLINGPRLDGDSGHASQRDIDAMFNPAI